MPRRPLIAGNWKMNGLAEALAELDAMAADLPAGGDAHADVLVCPPFTLLADAVRRAAGSAVEIGAQTCHSEASGAFTGDVSAEMIADAGAGWVIVGHSERRAGGESDADVLARATAGARAGLNVIVCVGETLEERDAGQAVARTAAQVTGSLPPPDVLPAERLVIAYEPVWAIGTGRTPSLGDIGEMHGAIRSTLAGIVGGPAAEGLRILYGGSVKPDNASEILAVDGVDGALVGGASLTALSFLQILKSVRTP